MRAVILSCLALPALGGFAQESVTVLGPTNLPLQQGADALRAGDAEQGVQLTETGLKQATTARERRVGKANLCAGYLLLEQYSRALAYCNEVLAEDDSHWRSYSNRALIYIKLRRFAEAEQDLLQGEAISPNSRTLRVVREMYRDATNPVAPSIIIDDRREPAPDDGDEG